MKRYQRKPEVVEAVQFDGTDDMAEDMNMTRPPGASFWGFDLMIVDRGDWLVRDQHGAWSIFRDTEFQRLFAPEGH